MKKDYVQPTMKVFTISADERVAAFCISTFMIGNDYCTAQLVDGSGNDMVCRVFDSQTS